MEYQASHRFASISARKVRDVAELIRQGQAFKHTRETGEVMPSGWSPGKATLKPHPDLVGKVWKSWKPETESANED